MRLEVLLVEDDPNDAELLMRDLTRGGLSVGWTRVHSAEQFGKALAERSWDVILADYSVPAFDALQALRLLHAAEQDLPFIVVSGVIGEEAAVETLKAGAHDFISKNKLWRLAPAVVREVREARVRRERREALERLRDLEARHRRTVESVRDYAIFMLDLDGRVASWNPGAERVLGYSEQEIAGHPFSALVSADPQEERATQARLAAAENETFCLEGFFRRRDGSRFWAECTADPIREAARRIGFSVVLRDTSERKRLVDELRRAIRSHESFMSVASHELRTPLTALRLQIDTCGRLLQTPGTAPSRETLIAKMQVVCRALEQLNSLVERLTDIDRVTTGQMPLDRERLDLGELAQAVVARFKAELDQAGCPIRFVEHARARGQWDRVRVDGIISNLLSNALKYAPGKPIDVTVGEAGENAVLTVTDHGIGIEPAEQQRIFEKFERAVPGRQYSGLGLGLWITQQSVRAHGGSIEVQSEPGHGASFVVRLPKEPGLAQTASETATEM